MKVFEKSILISAQDLKYFQGWLNQEIRAYRRDSDYEGEEGTQASWAVNFLDMGERIGVEINVVGGRPPYVDAVVFEIAGDHHDADWHEIYPLDPVSEDILGDYEFEVDDNKYIVHVLKGGK